MGGTSGAGLSPARNSMHTRVSVTGRVNQDSRKVGAIAGPLCKSPAASTDGAGDPALASPLSADPLRQFMTEIFLAGFSASLREVSISRSEIVRSNRLPSGGGICPFFLSTLAEKYSC